MIGHELEKLLEHGAGQDRIPAQAAAPTIRVARPPLYARAALCLPGGYLRRAQETLTSLFL